MAPFFTEFFTERVALSVARQLLPNDSLSEDDELVLGQLSHAAARFDARTAAFREHAEHPLAALFELRLAAHVPSWHVLRMLAMTSKAMWCAVTREHVWADASAALAALNKANAGLVQQLVQLQLKKDELSALQQRYRKLSHVYRLQATGINASMQDSGFQDCVEMIEESIEYHEQAIKRVYDALYRGRERGAVPGLLAVAHDPLSLCAPLSSPAMSDVANVLFSNAKRICGGSFYGMCLSQYLAQCALPEPARTVFLTTRNVESKLSVLELLRRYKLVQAFLQERAAAQVKDVGTLG